MARKRDNYDIGHFIRVARSSVADAKSALAKGDCGEAVRSIAHAYEMRGLADGSARVLRKLKGRKGGPKASLAINGMIQARNKIAQTCKLGSTLSGLGGARGRRRKRSTLRGFLDPKGRGVGPL